MCTCLYVSITERQISFVMKMEEESLANRMCVQHVSYNQL